MITVIIGHRGVGKTNFLKRIQTVLGLSPACVDLDARLSQEAGMSIEEIFLTEGEAGFRRRERVAFENLLHELRDQDAYVALGAGFEFTLPSNVHVLWLRRPSDARGRLFGDRPRLNPELPPLDEYLLRYEIRTPHYRSLANEVYFLREGPPGDPVVDAHFFGQAPVPLGGSLTVLPWMLEAAFFAKRARWGLRYYEFRDDLLDAALLRRAMAWVDPAQRLLSIRRRGFDPAELRTAGAVDWDISLGRAVPSAASIVSSHGDARGLEPFEGQLHLKWAPLVHSLDELIEGHRWWLENPAERSFLPRSWNGEWAWYRALFGRQMRLAFFREDEGSWPDQPLLADWMQTRFFKDKFAAILGDPVEHSWTPVYHAAFFADMGMPVVRIRCVRAEGERALELLRPMGLRAAAVTAPLKELVLPGHTVNTVAWDQDHWRSTNTDGTGLRAVLPAEIRRWAVWGGGGTLNVIREALPVARMFSARTGEPRSPGGEDGPYDGVIWACGRGYQMPPADWRPRVVVDLNYGQDSQGLEYALQAKCRYISGEAFFRAQAQAQQAFWAQVFQVDSPESFRSRVKTFV